ncbi:hypothetical protein SY88_15645 [Clostridiales bacterium PH28_bin88]|nr:hypothetical protein SY88_15645 [Clostridiales bacterium PH28_bin88]
MSTEFPAVTFLSGAGPESDPLPDVEVMVTYGKDINEYLSRLPKLRWIQVLRAGIDGIALTELKDRSIRLTTVQGIHGIPMSEHVFGMILQFSRRFLDFRANQVQKTWDRSIKVEEIYEKTLGVVGVGSIGREIAKRGKAFGMRTIGINSRGTPVEGVEKVLPLGGLPELLADSDYVVVTLPLTPETRRLFGEPEFRMMKPTAYFINVARGEVVDEGALARALQEKWISGAGLDVFECEPLPSSSSLWELNNVMITPHLAALSPRYVERAIGVFRQNLLAYLGGKDLANEVDLSKGY